MNKEFTIVVDDNEVELLQKINCLVDAKTNAVNSIIERNALNKDLDLGSSALYRSLQEDLAEETVRFETEKKKFIKRVLGEEKVKEVNTWKLDYATSTLSYTLK